MNSNTRAEDVAPPGVGHVKGFRAPESGSPRRRLVLQVQRNLKRISQRKLHYSRFGQRSRIQTDRAGVGERTVVGERRGVEAHRVGDVVSIRAEAQGLPLRNREVLVESCVDPEEALAAEIAALAGFAWIWQTQYAVPERGGIRTFDVERVRLPSNVSQFLGYWRDLHRFAFDLEVGVVGAASIDAEGEAAGPAVNSCDLPSAEEHIGRAIPVVAKALAAAKGQVVNPVRIDLMGRIEVGEPAHLLRVPRIDDGA